MEWMENTHGSFGEAILHDREVSHGDPALSDEAFFRYVHVEQIHGVINRLHFPDHDAPIWQFFGNIVKHSLTMILSLIENLEEKN